MLPIATQNHEFRFAIRTNSVPLINKKKRFAPAVRAVNSPRLVAKCPARRFALAGAFLRERQLGRTSMICETFIPVIK